MLEQDHQDFLGKYFKADTHYSRDDSPSNWLTNSKNVTSNDISKLLKYRSHTVREDAAIHPAASSENINFALEDNHPRVRAAGAANKNATQEHLEIAANDGSEEVVASVAHHPNSSQHILKIAYQYPTTLIKMSVVSHPNVSNDIITNALMKHQPLAIRFNAAHNSNISKENLSKALVDSDAVVSNAARRHPRYKEYFPEGHE